MRVGLHLNTIPSVRETDQGTAHAVFAWVFDRVFGLLCRGPRKKDDHVVLMQHCHVVLQLRHVETEDMPVNRSDASGHFPRASLLS